MEGRAPAGRFATGSTARHYSPTAVTAGGASAKPAPPVVNAMIETDRIQLVAGQPEMISIPSPSGIGQTVARCLTCKIALWSSYTIAGDKIRFVRACTLDDSDALPPQLHIFTKYKQPWMVLPSNAPSVPEFYRTADYWPAESIARWGDPVGEQKRKGVL